MYRGMAKFNKIIPYLVICFALIPIRVFAYELDMDVDDEIRKNYNPSALEDTLPNLPNIDNPSNSHTIQNSVKNNITKQPEAIPKSQITEENNNKKSLFIKDLPGQSSYKISDSSTVIKLRKGTKFKVKSLTNISDGNYETQRMSFQTLEPVTQTYITIPQGSTIKGVILNSHLPQLTGNGGLIEVKADSIIIDGNPKSINGRIINANNKHIFFNRIKGKRRYIANIPKYAKKGKPFYGKMMKTSTKLSQNAGTWILTPFTVIAGVAVYGTTIVVSPISALFSKGNRISIPAGSRFIIKLSEDSCIQR